MSATASGKRSRDLLIQALESRAGAVLVLDEQLRVVGATPSVEALLGSKIRLGVRAPRLLCGQAEQRPVAEALARGIPTQADVTRLTPQGERVLHVETAPLFFPTGREGEPGEHGQPAGHLIQLSKAPTPEQISQVGEPAPQAAAAHPVATGQELAARTGILTQSESMLRLLHMVQRVARADASVLVRGESGSGKELIARALHDLSPRHAQPFLAINCAALPEPLLESELFGHVRGAFTGAVRDTEGMFRRAHRGTLFLDEVGELPLPVQAKLLRVVQERQVLPVGSTRSIPVDVRIVSATHRSLRAEVEAGRFRADLMYRLRVIPLFLPSLRERPKDIEPLALHFLRRLNQRGERQVQGIEPAALRALCAHPFPGNVRELQNIVEFAYLLGEGPQLRREDLPPEVLAGPAGSGQDARSPHGDASVPPCAMPQNTGAPPAHASAGDSQASSPSRAAAAPSKGAPAAPPQSAAARRIQRALERADGNRKRAADSLGISRSTLWRRMKEHGLL